MIWQEDQRKISDLQEENNCFCEALNDTQESKEVKPNKINKCRDFSRFFKYFLNFLLQSK